MSSSSLPTVAAERMTVAMVNGCAIRRNLRRQRAQQPSALHSLRVAFTLTFVAVAIFCGCTNRRKDCEWLATCGESSDPAGGAASSGGSGAAGTSATTFLGNSDGGTVGGSSLTTATAAAGVAGLPCNGSCSGPTPYCDKNSNACVRCLTNEECPPGAPACSLEHVCVGCQVSADCRGPNSVCDTDNNTCVECTADSHCTGINPSCHLPTHTCVPCVRNSDCTAPHPVCHPNTHTCVACAVDADCPASNPACDVNTHQCAACTSDANCTAPTPACNLTTHACVGCTSDANCTAPTPTCNLAAQTCVACTSDAQCALPKPICASNNTCVECSSNAQCSRTKPLCVAASCVECVTSGDCAGVPGKTACDTTTNACVNCLVNADCVRTPSTPYCNTERRTCVGCLEKNHCSTAAASYCDPASSACVPCRVSADCSHVTSKGVCMSGAAGQANQCVQCTGKEFACGQKDNKSLVCDSLSHSCSTDKTVQSAGVCNACLSDAQCLPGQLCAEQIYNKKSVGYFCFWKQASPEGPAVCLSDANRPYSKAEANSVSIDGESATLCTLLQSTCPAVDRYRRIDCGTTGGPDDALCGFAAGQDSKCIELTASPGQFRCTVTCISDVDCPGGAGQGAQGIKCDLNRSPHVCTIP
ncbi:MAG TPA: hypothetical protein VIV60_16790 [Polyangiaceae bacterium]